MCDLPSQMARSMVASVSWGLPAEERLLILLKLIFTTVEFERENEVKDFMNLLSSKK